MKKKITGSYGFTLIELMVVVLIIGILSSIAVPQYRKSIDKARFAEALTTVNALEKAMRLYDLEDGTNASGQELLNKLSFNVNIPRVADFNADGYGKGSNTNRVAVLTNYLNYRRDTDHQANAPVLFTPRFNSEGVILWAQMDTQTKKWTRTCYATDPYSSSKVGRSFCDSLTNKGWVSHGIAKTGSSLTINAGW